MKPILRLRAAMQALRHDPVEPMKASAIKRRIDRLTPRYDVKRIPEKSRSR